MKIAHWLKRALRRFNRAAEETALAVPQPNAMGTKAVLGEIEKDEQEAQD